MKIELFLGCALVFGSSLPSRAEVFDLKYRITLASLPLGTASLHGTVGRDRYKLQVRASLTGLAGLVIGGSGAADSSGAIANGKPLSTGYALLASSSQLTRTIQMSIAGGRVGQVVINPPFDEHPDRVPVSEANRQGVVDPVGALIMPAPANPLARESCERILPVFDGAQRFDVTLSFEEQRAVKIKGYSGPALVCSARYTPISGHRPNRKQVVFMENNREMSAWLVPVGDSPVLVPMKISVKTQIGTVVIEADSISTSR